MTEKASKRPRTAAVATKPGEPEPGTAEYDACRRMMLGTDMRGSSGTGLPQLCTNFQIGRCTKGVMCTMAHGVDELEGALMKQQSGTRLTKLCQHWSAGTCRRGQDCWFAHGLDELERGHRVRDNVSIATARMDFSRPDDRSRATLSTSSDVQIPADQVNALMTDKTKQKLMEMAGPSEIHWNREACKVTFVGSNQQVEAACEIMKRVTTHCAWGQRSSKIDALLKPRLDYRSAKLTFSPMSTELDEFDAELCDMRPQISFGKDKSNDFVVKGKPISRHHAVVEFIPGKGCVYIVDLSLNGTYINGRRLPPEGKAKVVLWHGDEMSLQKDSDFGYMVTIEFSA